VKYGKSWEEVNPQPLLRKKEDGQGGKSGPRGWVRKGPEERHIGNEDIETEAPGPHRQGKKKGVDGKNAKKTRGKPRKKVGGHRGAGLGHPAGVLGYKG